MDSNNTLRKKMLAALRKADYDFGLFERGDKVLLGLSGGKDSMVLLDLLSIYRKFRDKDFELVAVHLDFGFPPVDFSQVEEYVRSLSVPYVLVEEKEVYSVLQQHRNEKTGLLPCSICSRMRKAIVNKTARRLGFSKVAFAHHMDDAIETLFLNMAYGGRVATFEPKMYLENSEIEFVRPLIYAREKEIERYCRAFSLPVAKNLCGNDKRTQREFMKEELATIYRQIPDARNNFAAMLSNDESFQLFFDRKGATPSDGLQVKRCSTFRDMKDVARLAHALESEEDFLPSDAIYYLLRKEGSPVAYLRAKEGEDFSVVIDLLETSDEALARFLVDVFEKNLSMRHVPRRIFYRGRKHASVFLSLGYVPEEGELSKTVTRALKI